MFAVSARPGKAELYFTIQPITFFSKATRINSFVTNPSSLAFPRQFTSIFPVIPSSGNCLSAFSQIPVYFPPHLSPPRTLSSRPSPLSPIVKLVLSAHDD